MNIDLAQLDPNQVYALMTQTVVPRPIAWVLSDNGNRSFNLAPFSYFNVVCSEPPLIMLSIGWKDDENRKDTWVNIAERNEFVIHIAHTGLLPELNESSATLPHGTSELERTGLGTVPFDGFRLPRLARARIAMACTRFELRELGDERQGLILGRVHSIYADDSVARFAQGRYYVDAEKLDPIARLGAGQFASLGPIVHLRRPG